MVDFCAPIQKIQNKKSRIANDDVPYSLNVHTTTAIIEAMYGIPRSLHMT